MANETKDKTVKIIVLTNNNSFLISEIEEVGASIPGEPDCKLVNPCLIKEDGTLEPYLLTVTRDDTFMMSSDKILTLCEPTPTLLEKYLDLLNE